MGGTRLERYPAYGERPKAGETSGDGVGQGKIRARVDESAEAGEGNLRAGRFRRARRDRPRSDGMELLRIRGADARGDPRPGARMDDFHRRLSRRGKPRSSQRTGRSAGQPNPLSGGRCRPFRPRTFFQNSCGPVARASRGGRKSFPSRYGDAERPELLPRRPSGQALERSAHVVGRTWSGTHHEYVTANKEQEEIIWQPI